MAYGEEEAAGVRGVGIEGSPSVKRAPREEMGRGEADLVGLVLDP